MRRLLTFTLVGLGAQMIDGSLGMAYGASSATFLIAAGYTPVLVSASIHLAEVGTTLVSGASHWRLGNVDWQVVRRIAVPGAIGAFAGATLLSSVDGDVMAPWTSAILFVLGLIVLVRFAFGIGANVRRRDLSRAGGAGVGLVGGVVDAIGGGGWGPIATPTLLTATKMEPRHVIGSVDTSEFLVSVSASIGFLLGIGSAGIDATVVVALLAGGVVAAPFAAWLVRVLPTPVLGIGVGGILLLTNSRTLVRLHEVEGLYVYPVIVAGIIAAAAYAAGQWGRQASSSAISASTSAGS
ncbi:MAG TPA: sulfite exporter TauE/SafE family protein [Acidimicrobiales bacterium]